MSGNIKLFKDTLTYSKHPLKNKILIDNFTSKLESSFKRYLTTESNEDLITCNFKKVLAILRRSKFCEIDDKPKIIIVESDEQFAKYIENKFPDYFGYGLFDGHRFSLFNIKKRELLNYVNEKDRIFKYIINRITNNFDDDITRILLGETNKPCSHLSNRIVEIIQSLKENEIAKRVTLPFIEPNQEGGLYENYQSSLFEDIITINQFWIIEQ